MNLYDNCKEYTVLNMKDREQWLESRKNYIGGSDASAVFGMNPYRSNLQLAKDKIASLGNLKVPDRVSNVEAMQYGTDAEAPLRELFALDFQKEYEVQYIDNTFIVSNVHKFMGFSPDGLLLEKGTNRKGILEIKTAEIFKAQHKERWDKQIPQNYFIQVLHSMCVLNADFAILKAQLKSTTKEDEIYFITKHFLIEKKDVLEDIEALIEKEKDFWNNYVLKGKLPNQIIRL